MPVSSGHALSLRSRFVDWDHDPAAFVMEVEGRSMEPAFRDGQQLVISPAMPIRRGDVVVVREQSGWIRAWRLAARSGASVGLSPLCGGETVIMPSPEIDWMYRVAWASQ